MRGHFISGVARSLTSFATARDIFADLWDRVIRDREVVRIRRRGTEDVALIASSELDSLIETAYLLRSPANAARLQAALQEVRSGNAKPMTLAELRREVGLAQQSEMRDPGAL